MSIQITSLVKYDSRVENLKSADVVALTQTSIRDFANENLDKFKSTFRLSRLVSQIDSSSPSILSNQTEVRLKFPVIPALSSDIQIEFSFQTELDLGDQLHGVSSIDTTGFISGGLELFISDDGNGNLYTYRKASGSRLIQTRNIGTVDYSTGKVLIRSIIIDGIADDNDRFFFFGIPKDVDFSSERDQILVIEDQDITITTENEAPSGVL